MKLFFKVVFLTALVLTQRSPLCWSRDIILLTYYRQKELALKAQKIIVEELTIPSLLVKLQRKNPPCLINSQSIVHLCFNEEGKMEVLQLDQETLKNSFGIFVKDISGIKQNDH